MNIISIGVKAHEGMLMKPGLPPSNWGGSSMLLKWSDGVRRSWLHPWLKWMGKPARTRALHAHGGACGILLHGKGLNLWAAWDILRCLNFWLAYKTRNIRGSGNTVLKVELLDSSLIWSLWPTRFSGLKHSRANVPFVRYKHRRPIWPPSEMVLKINSAVLGRVGPF